MAIKPNTYTVFDVMEAKGIFSSNPANATSPEYKGPQEYPKMMYHPEGHQKVVSPGEHVPTLMGPVLVNRHVSVETKMVANEVEEEKLRKLGWHDHPAKAELAAGREAPPVSSQDRIDQLESTIQRMGKELELAKKLQAVDEKGGHGEKEEQKAPTKASAPNSMLSGGSSPSLLGAAGKPASEVKSAAPTPPSEI